MPVNILYPFLTLAIMLHIAKGGKKEKHLL